MTNDVFNIELPTVFQSDTWDGLTWRLLSVDASDTEFSGTLSLARFQLQNSAGEPSLTLSSVVAGQVTINNSAANAWDVTVESRVLSLDPGTYSWGLETTDNSGIVKTRIAGTLEVKADPVV
jgi:hypothetical protein